MNIEKQIWDEQDTPRFFSCTPDSRIIRLVSKRHAATNLAANNKVQITLGSSVCEAVFFPTKFSKGQQLQHVSRCLMTEFIWILNELIVVAGSSAFSAEKGTPSVLQTLSVNLTRSAHSVDFGSATKKTPSIQCKVLWQLRSLKEIIRWGASEKRQNIYGRERHPNGETTSKRISDLLPVLSANNNQSKRVMNVLFWY